MNYGLVQTVAPTEEPVSTDLLSSHLRLYTDTETSLLATYITTARTLLEEWTQRQFMPATWQLSLDEWGRQRTYGFNPLGTVNMPIDYWPWPQWWRRPILLPKPPLISVTSIQYLDSNDTLQTLSTSDYIVDATREPARIVLLDWPSLSSDKVPKITITYQAGYETVPSPLCHAIMLQAADFYRQRETTTEYNFRTLPLGMQAILNIYRVGVLDDYGLER